MDILERYKLLSNEDKSNLTIYTIYDSIYDVSRNREISFEDEIISECEMLLETLQDYVREIGSVDEQESLNDFNNFSDLIQYEYGRKEVA